MDGRSISLSLSLCFSHSFLSLFLSVSLYLQIDLKKDCFYFHVAVEEPGIQKIAPIRMAESDRCWTKTQAYALGCVIGTSRSLTGVNRQWISDMAKVW